MVFEDKWWVQDSSPTAVYIFHLAINVSHKNVIHTARFVAKQALQLTKQIHCSFNSAFFGRK